MVTDDIVLLKLNNIKRTLRCRMCEHEIVSHWYVGARAHTPAFKKTTLKIHVVHFYNFQNNFAKSQELRNNSRL